MDRFGNGSLWNPFGVRDLFPILPSVRFATLGFGVELLCSSFQTFLPFVTIFFRGYQ